MTSAAFQDQAKNLAGECENEPFLLSNANPASAQLDKTPVQAPIGTGSAVWYTCVTCCVEG